MHDPLRPVTGTINLADIDPRNTGEVRKEEDIEKELRENQSRLYDLHYMMFAENRRSLLVVLQGVDASGKDGTVRYLAGGLNPQGCKIHSFKAPSELEIDHDFLWRIHAACPGRGDVAIFNRSHYEEVTTVKVHPELLERQFLPPEIMEAEDIFEKRYRQIRDFERMLAENGTVVLKFLLHISLKEQRERFEERIRDPKKLWKFSPQDLIEREFREQYMTAFEEMIAATSTDHAPWYVIPADRKWYRNYLIGRIVVQRLRELDMKFPGISG